MIYYVKIKYNPDRIIFDDIISVEQLSTYDKFMEVHLKTYGYCYKGYNSDSDSLYIDMYFLGHNYTNLYETIKSEVILFLRNEKIKELIDVQY